MPIQLNSTKSDFLGGPIDAEAIKAMVKAYRANRLKDRFSLKFAHFSVPELLKLLVSNGILRLTDAEIAATSDYGLKIYKGSHNVSMDTCPANRPGYKPFDTVILCNTTIKEEKLSGGSAIQIWHDMLKENDFVSLAGAGTDVLGSITVGSGLDRGSICPPDCDGGDGDGFYHDDIGSNF